VGKVGGKMGVKVIEEKKNPLLKREEIYCILEHPDKATPSREEMLPDLESVLKTKKDLIIIDKIFSFRGKGESKVRVLTYKKKEDIPKEKLEKMKRRMEKKKPEEKQAEEEKAPEVEKPSEEKEVPEKKEGAKTEEKEEKPEGK
jgi:small subunit ribosomal protein S24e